MFSLYQKYRPKRFSEITGQEHIVRTLSNSIGNDRLDHAYLFTGSRGIGKTTLARIFAKTINCLDPEEDKKNIIAKIESCGKCENCQIIADNKAIDLIEIDAASHTGVDNIRQIKENAQIPPSKLKYKIYIIDEVHMLSIGAFNALLKTLEEPPRHAIFILATTEIHKVPETIISRCQRFDFKRLSIEQITARLKQISEKEKVEVEDEALELIAFEVEGGMRDAESLLGQIISIEDKKITSEEVSDIIGFSSKKSTFDFTISFLKRDINNVLEKISRFQTDGASFKNIHKIVIGILRDILLSKAEPRSLEKTVMGFSPEQKKTIRDIIEKTSFEDLIFAIELLQKNSNLFKETSITQLPLEMTSIEFYLREQKEGAEKKENHPTKDAPRQEKKESISHQKEERIENKENESLPLKTLKNPTPKKNSSKNHDKQTPSSDISLELVMNKWSKILEAVKPFNHSIHAFLKNCIPLAIDDNQLLIKTKYDFYKERLNEENNKLTIKKVVDKITGCNLRVLVLTDEEAQRMTFENNNTGKDHNVLHDAMQMMGGKIVE